MYSLTQTFLLIFLVYLPFQIALSPTEGIDLASSRLFVLALLFVWLFEAMTAKRLILPSGKIALFLGSAFFLMLLSAFWAPNLGWALRKGAFILSFLPLYPIVYCVCDSPLRVRRVMSAVVMGAFGGSVVAIIQFFAQFFFSIDGVITVWTTYISPLFLGQTFADAVATFPSWLVAVSGATLLRAYGVFPDPHMLAFYMGMTLPLVLYLAYVRSRRVFFLCAAGMIGLADVLSFSRGGYLGVLAGTAAAVVTLLRSLGAWKKLIVVGAVLTVLVFLFFPGLPMGNRLWASFDLSEGSNIGRIETWKTAVTVISTAPLHGVGLGGYPIAVDPSAGYREPIYAHSIYLDIWAESGIFALIFWVLALGVVVVRTVQRPSPLLLALTTALLVHAVHSLVETPLYSVHILALLLVLFSLYDAVWTRNIDMRESKK